MFNEECTLQFTQDRITYFSFYFMNSCNIMHDCKYIHIHSNITRPWGQAYYLKTKQKILKKKIPKTQISAFNMFFFSFFFFQFFDFLLLPKNKQLLQKNDKIVKRQIFFISSFSTLFIHSFCNKLSSERKLARINSRLLKHFLSYLNFAKQINATFFFVELFFR